MRLVRIDWQRKRMWVRIPCAIEPSGWQRLHHGPWAIGVGSVLLAWGLSDLHDARRWFALGPQL